VSTRARAIVLITRAPAIVHRPARTWRDRRFSWRAPGRCSGRHSDPRPL